MKTLTFDEYLHRKLNQIGLHFQPPAGGRQRLLEAASQESNFVLNGSSHPPRNTRHAIRNPNSTILTIEKER